MVVKTFTFIFEGIGGFGIEIYENRACLPFILDLLKESHPSLLLRTIDTVLFHECFPKMLGYSSACFSDINVYNFSHYSL